MHDNRDLACAVYELAGAIRCAAKAHGETQSRPVTKQDLIELEESITMKISDVKTALQTASRQQKEALAEIGTQIADLNVKIKELQDAAADPDVTDAEFNTLVTELQTDAAALANIVPGSPTPETPPATPPAQPTV
ncbi:MAG TPA: hypothetical protein VHS96_14240 [Bacteroidia bacterium]|nr:hypothetical protein [Bacteroidia bacterium]